MNYVVYGLILFGLFIWWWEQKRSPKTKIPSDGKLPPGELGYPMIGNLLDVIKYGYKSHLFHEERFNKFGPTNMFSVHTKKYIIMAAEPECAEHILVKRFDNYEKSPILKEVFLDLLGTGIFASDGMIWKNQRRTASHLFKTGNMKTFMFRTFLVHSQILVDKISESAHEEKPVNMLDMFYRYTLDSIGVIAFGKSLKSLEKLSEVSIAFDEAQTIVGERFRNPFWKLQKLFGLGSEVKLAKAIETLNSFASKLIQERKTDKAVHDHEDILSRYISSTDESDEHIRDAIMNFLIAGRDTTGQSLTWMFYLLSQNPQVEKKLLEEIDTLWQGAPPTYEKLVEAKYLDGVIQETLRLFPPVPFDGKMSLKSDILPNGYYVPDSTPVIWSAYLMGRNENYWKNPLQFEPDRWVNPPKEIHPYLHIPFQAGPRLCLGKRMAMIEIAVCATILLQKFTFKYAQKEPLSPIVTITINVEGGKCLMQPIPRTEFYTL